MSPADRLHFDQQSRDALSLTMQARRRKVNYAPVAMIPFIMVHVAALSAFAIGVTWGNVLLCVGMYYLRMFGVTGGYHRYFAHRSFKTGRVFQFILAWLAASSAQKGVLWWASHHRNHHKYSDEPQDLHSPIQTGFWYSHVGWVLSPSNDDAPLHKIQDFTKYPELVWLDRFHLIPPFLLAVVLYLVGGMHALVWGFFVSTVLLWHGTFTINSLSHVFGSRRYATTDTSKNNFLLALITMGEGWHNNHHHYQSSCRQGFYWWEVDLTWYVIKALEKLGLVWEVRSPPQRVLDEGRRPAPITMEAPSLPQPEAAPAVEASV